MMNMQTFRRILQSPIVQTVYVTIFFLLVLLGGLLATRSGSHLSPDSVDYIIAAENFHSGKGFVSDYVSALSKEDVRPFVSWPPFYPFLVNLLMYFGIDSVNAARFIPIISYALFMPILFLFAKTLGSTGVGYLVLVISLIFMPFWQWTTVACTEMLYMILSIAALLLLTIYLKDSGRYNNWALIGAAILAACAPLTRYVGLTLIATGGLLILFKNRRNWRRLLFHSTVFGSITLIPIGLWMYRNTMLTGHASSFTGGSFNLDRFFQYMLLSLRIIYNDFFKLPLVIVPVLVGLFLPFLVLGVVYGRKQFANFVQSNQAQLLYIFVYWLGLLVVLSPQQVWASHNYRYMIPIYPFLILLFSVFAVHVFHNIRRRWVWIAYLAIIGSLSVLFAVPQGIASWDIYQHRKKSLGYNNIQWKTSQGLEWLKTNTRTGAYIYSGWWTANAVRLRLKRPTRMLVLPADVRALSKGADKQKKAFYDLLYTVVQKSLADNVSSYIIFFKKYMSHWTTSQPQYSAYYVDAHTIDQDFRALTVVADFKDSVILEVLKPTDVRYGWCLSSANGTLRATRPPGLKREALRISSAKTLSPDEYIDAQYPCGRPFTPIAEHILSFKLKAESPNDMFYAEVGIQGTDGNDYLLEYVPKAGVSEIGERQATFSVGEQYLDGQWHDFKRNLDEDLYKAFGVHFGYVKQFNLCVAGIYYLSDFKFETGIPKDMEVAVKGPVGVRELESLPIDKKRACQCKFTDSGLAVERQIFRSQELVFVRGEYIIDVIAKRLAENGSVPVQTMSVAVESKSSTGTEAIIEDQFKVWSSQLERYSTRRFTAYVPKVASIAITSTYGDLSANADECPDPSFEIEKVLVRKVIGDDRFNEYTFYVQWQGDRLAFVVGNEERKVGVISDRGLGAANKWHHVAVTLGMDHRIRFYIDGRPAGTTAITLRPHVALGPLTIGGYLDNAGDIRFNINGMVKGMHIYNRALTPKEIEQIFREGPNEANRSQERTKANLLTYFIYDAGKVQSLSVKISDSAVNVQRATLVTTAQGPTIEFKDSAYMAIPNLDPSVAITDELSIEAWINLQKLGSNRQVLIQKVEQGENVEAKEAKDEGY